jgi:hypothetical protein
MANDHNDGMNATGTEIFNSVFDYRLVAEWKQRFESPHSSRHSSGENNCGECGFRVGG